MPSFADIKSQALKAKDSATDKFNSAKDRYQVSTPSPLTSLRFTGLHDGLTSDSRRRTTVPLGITIHPNPGRNFLRHPRRLYDRPMRHRQDRNLI